MMYMVAYTLRFDPGTSGQPTTTDKYEIVPTIEDARRLVQQVMSINADIFYCYGIAQIVESSQPHWQNVQPMGLED